MDGADRLISAVASAQRVYESRERAEQWLNRPNPRLGGRVPAKVIETDAGAREVDELLGQIDEGFFV